MIEIFRQAAEGKIGLESDQIEHAPAEIFLPELNDGVKLPARVSGILEADRLQGSEAQGVGAAHGHHLDRHAALEHRG